MADYQIRVSADTQQANAQLVKVDRVADKATRDRKITIGVTNLKDIQKNYKKINAGVKEAANNIKTFYGVSKKLPGIGERVQDIEDLAAGTAKVAANAPKAAAGLKEGAKASNILATGLKTAAGTANTLITNLAKVGFAIYAVKEAVGILSSAYTAFFNATIGREIKLQETILKTQAALASTSKVFKGSTEITDPYEKIVTLTSQIESNIDSIRERSLDLAGVTSNDVIEVFGMVAQQIGQIGGGLQEAEDLAIQFAAALGTFGIPLYQARQEIGSILRGDITQDSYLAKALGITNEDVQKAKNTAEGLMGFLEKRLAASVAGQKIAAQSFSGVVSNIAEIFEEVGRLAGKPLLKPLLSGLSLLFESLFGIFKQLKGIATAAGEAAASILTLVAGGLGSADIFQGISFEGLATKLQTAVNSAFTAVQADIMQLMGPVTELFEQITEAVLELGKGFAGLAVGFADISIEVFKALVQTLNQLAKALTPLISLFGNLLGLYGKLLQQPIVQYFAQLGATLKILEATGLTGLIKLALMGGTILKAWAPVTAFFAGFVSKVKLAFARLSLAISKAFKTMSLALKAFAATLTSTDPKIKKFQASIESLSGSLNKAAATAKTAGAAASTASGGFRALAAGAKTAAAGIAIFAAKLIAIQLVIALVMKLIGDYQAKQAETRAYDKANAAIDELNEKFSDQEKTLTATEKAYKQYLESLADTAYQKAIQKVGELTAEIEKLQAAIDANDGRGRSNRGRLNNDSRKLKKALEEREKYLKIIEKRDAQRQEKNDKDLVKTMSENRTSMEKELSQLRKQLLDDEFRYQQQASRLAVEAERLRGELLIRQEERRNQKRLEGEEGASRAFLQNLNKYLSTKMRGELDIANREKELEIAMANLAKEAADYQLQVAKQIAELQKKMGQYQKDVADYQMKQARAAAKGDAVSGGTYQQGNIGPTSTGPHFDIKRTDGAYFDRAALDQFVSVNGGALSAGTTVPGGRFGASRSYGEHRGWDYAFEPGAQLSLKGGAEFVSSKSTSNGDATIFMTPDGTKYQILHGTFQPAEKGNVAPAAPSAPNTDISVDPSAVEGAIGAVEQMTRLVDKLKTDLKNDEIAAAFEDTFQGVFDITPLEQYDDQLVQIRTQMEALANNPLENPQAAAIRAQQQAELNRLKREERQIREALAEKEAEGVITTDQRLALEEQMAQAIQRRQENLTTEVEKKQEIASAQQALNSLQQVQNDAKGVQAQIDESILRLQLGMKGASQQQIALQVRLLAIERQRALALSGLTNPEDIAAVNRAYDDLIAKVKELGAAQEALANPITSLFSQWKRELNDTSAMIASLAQSMQQALAQGMANAVTGVIDGTQTVQEAMADMFKSIGRAFIEMATQMIAKALMMQVLGIFLPGAGAAPAAAGGGFLGGLFGFAEGGYVSGPTPALIGEGGEPEYVIPESKMESSLQRWSSGARGDQVVSGNAAGGGYENLAGDTEPYNPNININGGVLNFDGTEYIQKSELPAIIMQASKQGEARTLSRMRNSPTVRRKLAI